MKCLVTKLKETVNNPDLPVLETMQQITLDAIAASGNSSMTDAQKWALNHFFYAIGAINDSGIYSKLETMFLPFLASDVDHSLVDYVDYTTFATTNLTLANHAISSSSGNRDIAQFSTSNLIGISTVFLCGGIIRLLGVGTDSTGYTYIPYGDNNMGSISIIPKQTYEHSFEFTKPTNSVLVGISILGTSSDEQAVYVGNGTSVEKVIGEAKSDFRDVTVTGNKGSLRIYTSSSLYAAVSGSELSGDELETLCKEIQILANNFISA